MTEKYEMLVIPVINGDTVLFGGEEYKLIALSEEGVEQTGTPIEIAKSGLLAIKGDKIWYFGIPDEYLPFALINEILCPNVLDGEGLCLQALQDAEIGEAIGKYGNKYLQWRIDFFKGMEKYWIDVGNDERYAGEMKKCYLWLQGELDRRITLSESLHGVSRIL